MLQASYVILFVILISVILWFYNSALKKSNIAPKRRFKKLLIIVIILGLWLITHYIISTTGFYRDLSLPPRIPLFMIVPLFLFTIIFMYKNRNSDILDKLPIHIPIFFQSFRAFIEVLFYFTFTQGILPKQVTFDGYNYDVLLGISAIFMGLYAMRKNASKKLLIAWNITGIGIVLFAAFIFVTSFYNPSVWGESAKFISEEFNQFPYLLLPSFLMPSAIFVHIVSITQLIKQSNS